MGTVTHMGVLPCVKASWIPTHTGKRRSALIHSAEAVKARDTHCVPSAAEV